MGGAYTALAVSDKLVVEHQASCLSPGSDLGRVMHRPVGPQIFLPRPENRAGDVAASRCPPLRAGEFGRAAHVNDAEFGIFEPLEDLLRADAADPALFSGLETG